MQPRRQAIQVVRIRMLTPGKLAHHPQHGEGRCHFHDEVKGQVEGELRTTQTQRHDGVGRLQLKLAMRVHAQPCGRTRWQG